MTVNLASLKVQGSNGYVCVASFEKNEVCKNLNSLRILKVFKSIRGHNTCVAGIISGCFSVI